MRPQSDQLTQQLLVELLADAPDDYLPADAICGKLGLPKTVVFRQIDRLRGQGYRIDNRPARGYRLLEVPDRLTSLEIAPFLTSEEIGRRIHAMDEVDSTNDVARSLAEDGAAHGEVVVAERQRHGKGRRGRTWLSEPHRSLTFSVILRPDLPLERAHELTLVTGVALSEVFRESAFEAKLKWPNDVVIGSKKVAGILTESCGTNQQLSYAVVGIGINVNSETLPDSIAPFATSLRMERGEPLPRALLLANLLASLERWLEQLVSEGPKEMLERARAWSATIGQKVTVEGATPMTGVAEGIDDDGALLVRDTSGALHHVTAGDVSIR